MDRPTVRAWLGLAALLAILFLAIFIPAGTLAYAEGWAYVALFGACTAAITVYLQKHDPALLQRRTAAGPVAETEPLQRVVQAVASVAFVGIFVVAGLDRRFGWSGVPAPLVALGDVLVVTGFAIVFLVFRANSYTSATIEAARDQPVIDTGPYAIVRHPMYSGALLMLAGTAPALGSWRALACVAAVLAAIVVRLLHEERFLARTLPGYDAYLAKVRRRLVPGVW
jgi:protein-S-isoprenylcysteine O-methyltransferase Ste14